MSRERTRLYRSADVLASWRRLIKINWIKVARVNAAKSPIECAAGDAWYLARRVYGSSSAAFFRENRDGRCRVRRWGIEQLMRGI